jgi:hypothetical protein
MQKYLWGGAALIMVGAAACYVGVDYAARHPESFLGRCCAAVSTATIHCNPLNTMNTAVNGTVAPAQPSVSEVAESPVVPQAVQRSESTTEQTIEPIQVEDVQPDLGVSVGWHRIEGTEDSEPLIDFSGLIVPNEEPIMPMPYADAEDIEDLVVKPEADNQANRCEGSSELEDLWFRMWVKKKKILGLGAVEQGEECEPPANDGAMDDAKPLPKWIKKWFKKTKSDQNGECENSISSLRELLDQWFGAECEAPVSDIQVQVKETFYMNVYIWGTMNSDAGLVGSIVLNERNLDIQGRPAAEQLPNMPEEEMAETEQEMPTVIEQIEEVMPPMIESNYRYHHQGCPYMGGCPYCPPHYPVQSAVRIPDVQLGSTGGLVIIEGRPAAEQLPDMPEEEVNETNDEIMKIIEAYVRGIPSVKVAGIEIEGTAVDYDTPSLRRLRNFVKVKKVSIWQQFLLHFGTRSSWPFNDTMEFRPSDDLPTVTPEKFLFNFGGIPY